MASSVKSLKGTPRKACQSQIEPDDKHLTLNKKHEKHLRRRSRSFSSGDAHALYTQGGTNVYDARQDWLDCLEKEGFFAALPLSLKSKDSTPLSLLVLESILSKYDVDESDFDDVDVEVGGITDDGVEIKELYNLELFTWNLEKSFEEKETNSLDEYFALLEQCLQTKSYRIRSNSTGSYELPLSTSCSKETTANRKENNTCGQRKKTSIIPQELGNVLDRSILQENSLHAICVDEEKQEIHRNLTGTEDEVSTPVQKTNQVKNGPDTEILHGNQLDSESCNLLGMVSLATPVWSHDHTYCLTCSPTTNSENDHKGVSMVTRASRDSVVQLELNKSREIPNNKIGFQTDVVRVDDDTETRDSSAMDGADNLPNKERSVIVIAVESTEPHDLNKGRGMPYVEMSSNAEHEGMPKITQLLCGKQTESREVPDKQCDTPNKEKLESDANGIYKESESRNIPNEEILLVDCGVTYDLLESRDGHKSRYTPIRKDCKDDIISSEETNSKDIDESRETPNKKIRKAVENNVGAVEDKPRDSTKTRDICPNPTTSKNKSFSNEDVTSIGNANSTPPPPLPSSPPSSPPPPSPPPSLTSSPPLLTPPPTSELQKTSRSDMTSPTRCSKRTRKPTQRRLDTYYY